MEGEIEPYTITVGRKSYIELLPLAPRPITAVVTSNEQLCRISSDGGVGGSLVSRMVSSDSLDCNNLSFVDQSVGKVQNPVLCSLEPSQSSLMLLDTSADAHSVVMAPSSSRVLSVVPKPRKRIHRRGQKMANTPRPPSSAYVLFSKEQRPRVQMEQPELSFAQITKVLGKRWSQMSYSQKQAYFAAATEDKERYKRELKSFKNSEHYQRFTASTETNGDEEPPISPKSDLHCSTCDQYFLNSYNKEQHFMSQNHRSKLSDDLTNFERETRCCQCRCCQIDSTPDPLDVEGFVWSYTEMSKERDFELTHLRERRRQAQTKISALKRELDELMGGQKKVADARLAADHLRQVLDQQRLSLKSLLHVFESDNCLCD